MWFFQQIRAQQGNGPLAPFPGAGSIASCSLRGRMRQTNHLNARETQVRLLRRTSLSAPSWHSGVPLWGHRAECEVGFPGGKGVGQESSRWAVPDPAGLDLHVVWSADFPWVCSWPGPQVSPPPLTGMWVNSNFRWLFFYLVYRLRLLILTFNLPFDTSGVSC